MAKTVVHWISVAAEYRGLPIGFKSRCGLFKGEMGEMQRRFVTCKNCLRRRPVEPKAKEEGRGS